MTDLNLDAIKARCDAATPGPWAQGMAGDKLLSEVDYYGAFGFVILNGDLSDDGQYGVADAAFIAHAREDVPSLVAEVERLRAVLELARAVDWGYVGNGLGIIDQTRCVGVEEHAQLVTVEATFDAFLAALYPEEPSQ